MRRLSFVGVRWLGRAGAGTDVSTLAAVAPWLSSSNAQPPGSCGPDDSWRRGAGRCFEPPGETGESVSVTGEKAEFIDSGEMGERLSLVGEDASAVARENGTEAGEPGPLPIERASGEGLRDAPEPDGIDMDVTRGRSAGDSETDDGRPMFVPVAGASISNTSIGSPA